MALSAMPLYGNTYDKLQLTSAVTDLPRFECGDLAIWPQEAGTGGALKLVDQPPCEKFTEDIAMLKALLHESMASPTESHSDAWFDSITSTAVPSPFKMLTDGIYLDPFNELVERPEHLWSDTMSESTVSLCGDDIFDTEFLDDCSSTDDEFEPENELLDLSGSNFTSISSSILIMPDMLNNITVLDLSHNVFDPNEENYLTDNLFLPHLNTFYVESCGLTTLEPLFRRLIAPSLQMIDISSHRLTGPVPRFRAYWLMMKSVYAGEGYFDALDTSSLMDLTLIDLRNNSITRGSISKDVAQLEKSGTTILI